MARPEILDVTPTRGTTLGGELVRVRVRHAAAVVQLIVGGRPVAPDVREEVGGAAVFWVALPPQLQEDARLVVQNLTASGTIVVGERAEWEGFLLGPADLTGEGLLVRITRALLRALKSYAAPTARIAVAIDFEGEAGDAVRMVSVAEAPALTLAGPRLEVDRLYAPDRPTYETVVTPEGVRRLERTAAVTVDLIYELTGTARSAVELLNLMAATSTFLARTRWLELPQDPTAAASPLVRWELDADAPFQAQLGGRDGVQVFTTQVRVRGVTTDWSAVTAVAAGGATTQLALALEGRGREP